MAGLRVFHIDSGRKYFPPKEIGILLSEMAENGFDALEIAIGNGGWRLLTDDLALRTPEGDYADSDVRRALEEGSRRYCDCGKNTWTGAEMDGILAFAKARGIGIIPLLNMPGHMEAVIEAMGLLGIPSPALPGSRSTVDPGNAAAIGFASALVKKYIDHFAARGCRYINFGADEFGIDLGGASGFARLQEAESDGYDRFIACANDIADHILSRGAVPVMYNDGMYYACHTGGGRLRRDIVCSYWTDGWPGYDVAPARFISSMGHPILSTCRDWYYVLGRRGTGEGTAQFTYEKALQGIDTVPEGTVIGGGEAMGSMVCVWCDEPEVPYDEGERERVLGLIRRFAERNKKR